MANITGYHPGLVACFMDKIKADFSLHIKHTGLTFARIFDYLNLYKFYISIDINANRINHMTKADTKNDTTSHILPELTNTIEPPKPTLTSFHFLRVFDRQRLPSERPAGTR